MQSCQKIQGNEGSSGCGKKRCDICPYIDETSSFQSQEGREYKIRAENLNCDSKHVVYLVTCKTCGVQYVGSTCPPFRLRYNNYRSCHRRHILGKKVPQASFHAHFAQSDHHGMEDCQFTFIDHAVDLPSVRRQEVFWQYTLDSFFPKGLNEQDVPLDFG